MTKTPKCLKCGSADLIYPGFISFVWRRGRWQTRPGWTAEMADGAPIHCQVCGCSMLCADLNDPAEGLELAPTYSDYAERMRP